MSRRRGIDHAQSGSAVVSQYQRRGGTRASSNSGVPSAPGLRGSVKTIAFSSWTAVTTGYPDAAGLGNVTLYQADVAHNLGVTHAGVIDLVDATGLHLGRPHLQSNDDPANPGNLHYNSVRIWISADAAPAADIIAICVG